MLGIESNQSGRSFPIPRACQVCREGSRGKNCIKVGVVARVENERRDGAWDLPGLLAPGTVGIPFLAKSDPRCVQIVLPADAGLQNG